MVKEPRPGRVKSRLGRDIGMVEAAWWFRRQATRLIRDLRDPRWEIVLAVAPDRDGLLSRVWPSELRRIPQGGGDLGARMRRVLAATPGPTVMIGADIPGITRAHVWEAFGALGPNASVIGPAVDGGFWMIGLHMPGRQATGFFRGIRWSHAETLADTLPTLPTPYATVAVLSDVDTVDDLAR